MPDFSGVAIHGDGKTQDELRELISKLGKCIKITGSNKAQGALDELSKRYKRSVVWVEIGKEWPVDDSPTCSAN